MDFKSLKTVIEVKWVEKLKVEDLEEIEGKLRRFQCRRILFIPNRETLPRKPRELEVWDVKTLLNRLSSSSRHVNTA